MKPVSPRKRLLLCSALGCSLLSGCASVSLEQVAQRVNQEAPAFTQGRLALYPSEETRQQAAEAAQALLASPLGQHEAVQLALLHNPALQALLAQAAAEAADAAQSGRISNPLLGLERLVAGDQVELNRALSFGLWDLLTWPSRQRLARQRIEQAQLRLVGDVVDQVTQVRQAWVRAVAAGQALNYARQVQESAEAAAELARRMQAAGNFNRLNRAREQAFYADATTRLALASHQALATREALVRLLGLDQAQAQALQLPDRLPDLPQQALEPQAVGSQATRSRLDIRLAQTTLDAAAKAQGLNALTRYTDIELTARHNSNFDTAAGTRSDARGYEIGIRLPVFDWGGMQREAWNARTLAAAQQLEATVRVAGSSLRESYSAYRTAHDIARHLRDEVLPLRKLISEENQLRYNGMFIGVFELLADARDQVQTVLATMEAQQQFWLADAALQAAIIGRPGQATSALSAPGRPPASGAGAGH